MEIQVERRKAEWKRGTQQNVSALISMPRYSEFLAGTCKPADLEALFSVVVHVVHRRSTETSLVMFKLALQIIVQSKIYGQKWFHRLVKFFLGFLGVYSVQRFQTWIRLRLFPEAPPLFQLWLFCAGFKAEPPAATNQGLLIYNVLLSASVKTGKWSPPPLLHPSDLQMGSCSFCIPKFDIRKE